MRVWYHIDVGVVISQCDIKHAFKRLRFNLYEVLGHVFCFVFEIFIFYDYDCNVYIRKSLGEKEKGKKGGQNEVG